jgi:hypothetical protein
MPYRKVGYMEQCWYLLRFKVVDIYRKVMKCPEAQSGRVDIQVAQSSRTEPTVKNTEK